MPFSDTYANRILNWIFGKSALANFDKVYIGLCSNDPETDGGKLTELSGNGYKRVLISQYNQSYPDYMGTANARAISNNYQINWSKATGDWLDVKGFFLCTSDISVIGSTLDVIFYGAITDEDGNKTSIPVSAGSVALFDPAAFKLSFPEADITAVETTTEE